jgi:hypothetical protein
MGREELTTGGWFDPDKSRVHDKQTADTTIYTRDLKLYETKTGSLIRRWPATHRETLISREH